MLNVWQNQNQRDFRDLSRNLRARTPSVSRSAWFYTRNEVGILYPPILSTRGTFWDLSVHVRSAELTDLSMKNRMSAFGIICDYSPYHRCERDDLRRDL
jgi:hypothetical protein